MPGGVGEVWRMFRSESRAETAVAVVAVVIWIALAWRRSGGGKTRR